MDLRKIYKPLNNLGFHFNRFHEADSHWCYGRYFTENLKQKSVKKCGKRGYKYIEVPWKIAVKPKFSTLRLLDNFPDRTPTPNFMKIRK
jgi:hypothetical protein